MQGFEPPMREPVLEGGGHRANSVLQEGEVFLRSLLLNATTPITGVGVAFDVLVVFS